MITSTDPDSQARWLGYLHEELCSGVVDQDKLAACVAKYGAANVIWLLRVIVEDLENSS